MVQIKISVRLRRFRGNGGFMEEEQRKKGGGTFKDRREAVTSDVTGTRQNSFKVKKKEKRETWKEEIRVSVGLFVRHCHFGRSH
jgi:hypothetical protein